MTQIFKRPRTVLLLMTLLVVGVGHRAAFIVLDNSPETFFAADPEARKTYKDMVRTFGADEVTLFDLDGASPDNPADLLALARLAREVAKLDGVVGVMSIADSFDDRNGPLPDRLDDLQVAGIRKEMIRLSHYRSLGLVRPDAPALGVIALLVMEGPDARTDFTDTGQAIADRFTDDRLTTRLIGLTPTNAAFDRETRRALLLFMPGVVLVSLLIGFALFRSVKALVALFFPVLGAVALGVAGLALFGETLNLVTAVLPPLVMAIGFAGAIHLVSHYGSLLRVCADPLEAARQTIRDKFAPTAFAFVTTAVGFGSLGISEVGSVRVLGLSAAATLIITLVLVTFGTPAFLLWLRPTFHSPTHRQRLLERLAGFSLAHRWPIVLVAAVLVVVAAFGVPRLRQSINGTKLLRPDAPVRVAYERLEKAGVGLGNIDLWIHKPLSGRRALLGELDRLGELSRKLEKIPLVTATLSARNVIDQARFRLEQGAGRPVPVAALAEGEGEKGDLLEEPLGRVWQGANGLKVTVLTRTADREVDLQRQKEAIWAAVRAVYPSVRVDMSGHYTMLIGTSGSLMETLGQSLGLSVLVISALLVLFLRSPLLSLVAMVANLIPVLAVLGVMGWLDIPLDVATVMTASVAFGLAVDDTFHYLYHYLGGKSIMRAAAVAGQGIVATTMVVAGGFLALGFAGFDPVVRFGLLTAGAAMVALTVDGLLLPAILGRKDELDDVVDT